MEQNTKDHLRWSFVFYCIDGKIELVVLILRWSKIKETTVLSAFLAEKWQAHKISAENLFSLPICDIMELMKSLPPGGRWHGVAVTEGACVTWKF